RLLVQASTWGTIAGYFVHTGRRLMPLADARAAMALIPYALPKSLLFRLDPETAHDLTMAGLARFQNTPLSCVWGQERISDPVEIAGLRFPNRIGMAAGLDKNGRCIDGIGAMGFGFV